MDLILSEEDRSLGYLEKLDGPLAVTPGSSAACLPASGIESQPEMEHRPRFGMRKVRTGCVVCKIRRVKCDETKPYCIRCTSTGRKCEGYALVPERKPRRGNAATDRAPIASSGAAITGYSVFQLPAVSPNPALNISAVERESLHFFWAATEHDVSRNFEPHFWGRVVLQASREYSTVQYALDAVSSLYKAYMTREHATHQSQGVLDTPTTRLALLCYNKAVKLISDDLAAGKIPLQAVLICCLLFIWLEFLRNDFATGMKHLQSGLAILQEAPGRCNRSSPALVAIDESIPHVFTRLQIQATLHGCPASDFNSSPMKCPSEAIINSHPSAFFTLAEARYSLDSKLVYVFQFVREKQTIETSRGTQASECPEWPQLAAKRDAHITELMEWNAAFQQSSLLGAGNSANSIAILLLQLNFEVAFTVLKTLFFDSEMQYDEYTTEFRQMLTLIEKILQSRPNRQCPVLSLDMGIIPALCYIILKCRERSIRYKAMELLKSAPEREGMWHRDSIIVATNWKVTVEERLAAGVLGVDQSPLPISARIYREKVRDASMDGKSAVVRFDGGPAGSSITEWELNGLLSRLGDMM
ncbi:hypothetical protein F5Y13DRAFT_180413 [Hypoxylon sp. FL1857]|nr:hypothetical protein F5Y13DRAFT_180413 [Hypoxylon sp. FL1857]